MSLQCIAVCVCVCVHTALCMLPVSRGGGVQKVGGGVGQQAEKHLQQAAKQL